MDAKYKTFINPCKLYARIKNKDIKHINGFKVELDTVTLFCGSTLSGYLEEHYMLDEVEIFEQ